VKTAVCCIAKNEDDYLAEWVDYNARLGFDEIHVLQHGDWRYRGPAHPALRLGEFPQDMHQRDALNGWLDAHRHDFDWAAFFDVDEYLVLKNGDCNVKDFLARYDRHGGVAVNWKRFGDAGLEDDGDRRIVARFTRCEAGLSHEVKTIAHLSALPEDARLAGMVGFSWGGTLAYRLCERWSRFRNEKPFAMLGDTYLINAVDGYRQQEVSEKDFPENLFDLTAGAITRQEVVRKTNISIRMDNTVTAIPAYDGSVIMLNALKNYSEELKRANLELLKKLAKNAEIIDFPNHSHNDLFFDEHQVPIFLKLMLQKT
jgi:hypothetical protein